MATGGGTPGGSARREVERSRAGRERRVRARFPRLGGLLLAVAREPERERAWRKGAEGEERAGSRLERLLTGRDDVRVLHDLRLPGSRGNIDHITIGPSGVIVIDTKNWTGKVDVRREGGFGRSREESLVANGHRRRRDVDALIRRVLAVRAVVGPGIEVRGAFCLVGANGLSVLRQLRVNGLAIANVHGIARMARKRGSMDAVAVAALADQIEDRFPAMRRR